MYCPNCSKQVEDGVHFCPHCGANTGQPQAPAQVPPQPQPSYPGAPGAPPYQPAPPYQTPYAAAPPRKKSSSCWLIGCIILAVLVILGGIGTCVAVKYAGAQSGPLLERLMEMVNPGASGAGAEKVMREMFAAWAAGDTAAVKATMTSDLAASFTDDVFSTSYEPVDLKITRQEQVSPGEWTFSVEESFRNTGSDEVQTDSYNVRAARTAEGWRIAAISIEG
ncbi:MAG TPA: zinc ribbon domain-containing protein [Armatimonadota bacterium]|nr:zinc ribbon domain-containing protein [Armatimonadota bacterium]